MSSVFYGNNAWKFIHLTPLASKCRFLPITSGALSLELDRNVTRTSQLISVVLIFWHRYARSLRSSTRTGHQTYSKLL
jgi:hypothetical protein